MSGWCYAYTAHMQSSEFCFVAVVFWFNRAVNTHTHTHAKRLRHSANAIQQICDRQI